MNTLKNYFVSPVKSSATENASETKNSKDKNHYSETIATNMKEVIDSVNKKEKRKQRRKRETLQKSDSDITNISNIMSNNLSIVSPNVSTEEIELVKYSFPDRPNSKKKTSDKSKSNRKSNDVIEIYSPEKNNSTMPHFPDKQNEINKVRKQDNVKIKSKDQSDGNKSSKLNAFEIMMNARNRSIGSNSPGKEDQEENDTHSDDSKILNAKRKLMLEEWAERKGALKRKLDDEMRGEYIELQLQKRNKTFKNMLVNGRNRTTLKRKCNEDNNSSHNSTSEDLTQNKSEKRESKRKVKERQNKAEFTKNGENKVENLCELAAVDSIDLELSFISNDKHDDNIEFVSKLSSPLKKRDSLLGYFPKLSPSPKNEKHADTNVNDSKRKRKYVKKNHNREQQSMNSRSISKLANSNENGDLSRPKRSCARKARYRYDSEDSGTRSSISDKTSKIDTLKDIKPHEELEKVGGDLVEVIVLDTSLEEKLSDINTTPRKNVLKKLAPVFIKPVPKPSPDPELLRAKNEFLMSGVPEKVKQEIAKQKQYEQIYEASIEVFPKISHVMQAERRIIYDVMRLDLEKLGMKWRKEENEDLAKVSKKSFRQNLADMNSTRSPLKPLQKLPELHNKIQFIKTLKVQYEKFLTYRCYNQLREKYRSFTAKDIELYTHQVNESFVVTRSNRYKQCKSKQDHSQKNKVEDDKPPPFAPNGELLFTEKYKPTSSDQVLVNASPVNLLKDFLSLWQNTKGARKEDSFNDSDFVTDSSSNSANPCTVVLLGPSSSGKTNAVFALANEMNFNVLEINAGMKRSGKKFLQELQEATQSHQVSKDNKSSLLKQSLNGIRKKPEFSDSSSSSDPQANEKLSLILVEDADVVFEQDAGFVEAIYQLSASSKRPVIITANNFNCQHLLKLINQHSIKFSSPNILNVSKFLSILSLVENCPVNLDDIVSLYLLNKRDLRRTLLEMQFFIQSGGDRKQIRGRSSHQKHFASPRCLSEDENFDCDEKCINKEGSTTNSSSKIYIHKTLFDFYTTCQNIKRKVPFPINYDILWSNISNIFKIFDSPSTKRRKNSKSPFKGKLQVFKALESISDFYENVSVAASFSQRDNVDRLNLNLDEDIGYSLIEGALDVNLQSECVSYNLFGFESERSNLTSYMSSPFSVRTNRSISLDYEPCLRSICRSEKSRLHNERRGSRFYHYLRNTCVNVNSFSTNIFDNVCSVLMNDPTTDSQ